jgi:hypothetical protein
MVIAPLLGGCQKIDPKSSVPKENPFQETNSGEVNPSSTGNNNTTPTATDPKSEGTTVPPDISGRTGEPLPDWMLIPWSTPK